MFGFVRVQDSTTSLPKFVLIQWVRRFKISRVYLTDFSVRRGSSSDSQRPLPEPLLGRLARSDRRTCYHPGSLRGTILLRCRYCIESFAQSDLDPAVIRKRVADSSGSKYSVHNEKPVRMTAPPPVVRFPSSVS
jgi:hypothetical protein